MQLHENEASLFLKAVSKEFIFNFTLCSHRLENSFAGSLSQIRTKVTQKVAKGSKENNIFSLFSLTH